MRETRIVLAAEMDMKTMCGCWLCVAVILLLSVGSLAVADTEVLDREAIKDAIVKVYTVTSKVDNFRPWNAFPGRSGGSGCIIGGKRVLTNAHVVADQVLVEVRRHGHSDRYQAQVLSVSHEADLALLAVPDDAFFEGVTPLELGELPRMQQEVLVLGFPMGGDTLSVTKGVVSRIEHQQYTHSGEYLLAGQIDAAINPGNSGGPVVANGRIVGVVMQMYKTADNIGYMVPVPIVERFFADIGDGTYDGFGALGLVYQTLENPSMKQKYGMAEGQTGVFVRHIFPDSPATGVIQIDDVVLSIDGHAIADNGTVELRPKERTSFIYHVDRHQLGESVALRLLRNSQPLDVTVKLSKRRQEFRLVSLDEYDRLPTYFIYGGIVFTPLTKNLIKAWGNNWHTSAPREFVVELGQWPTAARREIVVATQVLAADVNKGYHSLGNVIIDTVNGRGFRDFREFFQTVTTCQEPFLVFASEQNYQVVVDTKVARESHERVIGTYRIASDRSDDLR